jgi:hypothetical protein
LFRHFKKLISDCLSRNFFFGYLVHSIKINLVLALFGEITFASLSSISVQLYTIGYQVQIRIGDNSMGK